MQPVLYRERHAGKLSRQFGRPTLSHLSVFGNVPGQGFVLQIAVYKECVTPSQTTNHDNTDMEKIVHPLLAMIASATDRELARYVEFLKEENRIREAPVEIQTLPLDEVEMTSHLGGLVKSFKRRAA